MIRTAKIETRLGTMVAGAVDEGICLLDFIDGKNLKAQNNTLAKYFNDSFEKCHSSYFSQLTGELEEYFEGNRKEFTIPLVLAGSEFQKTVWQELINIPYGTTRTYLEQASSLGNPRSIRAVAHANGMNRISIIIPCHRVIGSDGSLTGYGGGLMRKKWLLEHEKRYSGQAFDQSLF
jgi:AraC family transcriptional regulator, regulatory protein of adaptative response / methylated-DNA-[protein]-cysteine methyltransferase